MKDYSWLERKRSELEADYKIGKIIGKSSMFLHDLAILSIIELENNVLITCSTDSTIKIWKFEY